MLNVISNEENTKYNLKMSYHYTPARIAKISIGLFCVVLEIEARASSILDKCSIIKLHL